MPHVLVPLVFPLDGHRVDSPTARRVGIPAVMHRAGDEPHARHSDGAAPHPCPQERSCGLTTLEPHATIPVMDEAEQEAYHQGTRKPLAHIVIGFIGSGKTTFARQLEQETGAVRFTKDEWMVRLFGNAPPQDTFEEYDKRMASLATDIALKCLAAGTNVILDEGFWLKEQRAAIRDKVKNVGAVPIFYYLDASFELLKARTLKRSESPPLDSYIIDEESFNRYWKFFQPPDTEEEFELITQARIEKKSR